MTFVFFRFTSNFQVVQNDSNSREREGGREREQKQKPESEFHVINLASVPTYREPIRIEAISV